VFNQNLYISKIFNTHICHLFIDYTISIYNLIFIQHLGDSTDTLKKLADGSHPFCKKLASASNPVVIVGSEALQRPDSGAVLSLVQQIASNAKVTIYKYNLS
jgi:hypothetical protein